MKLYPGLYDQLLTKQLEAEALEQGFDLRLRELDSSSAHVVIGQYLERLLARALSVIPEADRPAAQVTLANEIIRWLLSKKQDGLVDGDIISEKSTLLASVSDDKPPLSAEDCPLIPLNTSELFVNGRNEPRLGEELRREILSADRIDLLCAFVKWYGLRVIEEPLAEFLRSGRELRLITTTYMGATEQKPLDWLFQRDAKIKVSYETESTRLHAKAWLFHRNSGSSTAYIGSSNLSYAALLDGVEWNVRLSQQTLGPVLNKFQATFDTYWNDTRYELYDAKRFAQATARDLQDKTTEISFRLLDVDPRPHQREILDALEVERYRHGRWKNLVVAATGTGKTVIAALDYRRLREQLPRANLLFVAHRKEILTQSLRMFRDVLRDGSFGELYVDGKRPEQWSNVFASIQSLTAQSIDRIDPHHFDVLIVDEFHHAAAKSYETLLNRLRPKVLLGLTATPERGDGESILHWFDDRIAAELRIWDALEQDLLIPFQYFGIHDDVDLEKLSWKRGGYDLSELSNLYTNNDSRVAKILQQMARIVPNVAKMKALGFCVSIDHAKFMAKKFSEAGVPSVAIVSEGSSANRDEAIADLKRRDGKIRTIFCVDIFNEGVDIPAVDTVLMLRPTESPTVFLQQLGRGLRRHPEKACLTVLDFIGNQNRKFRFDQRFSALIGCKRRDVAEHVEQGFPFLPAGCHIDLDRDVSRIVLENLKQTIETKNRLVQELKDIGDVSLLEFIRKSGVDVEDIYRSNRNYRILRQLAGFPTEPDGEFEDELGRSIGRLLHNDDVVRVGLYRKILSEKSPPKVNTFSKTERRSLHMLHFMLWGVKRKWPSIDEAFVTLWKHKNVLKELSELFELLDEKAEILTKPLPELSESPIQLYGRYDRAEIRAAFDRLDVEKPYAHQEGCEWIESFNADIFFVTLRKNEKGFTATTLYNDFAVSPEEFHWESQSRTAEKSPTGQRYIHHAKRGSRILLFVRETKTDPFVALGPAEYVSHESERPMKIIWKMKYPIPEFLLKSATVVAA